MTCGGVEPKYLKGDLMQRLSIIILSLFICANTEATPEKLKTVFVSKTEKKELFDLLAYPTKVLPKKSSRLLAETEGVVESIRFNLGDTVKKGQPLIVIKHTDPVYQFRPFTLNSPIDGVVAEIHETQGSMVSKGTLLVTITDPTEYKMRFDVTATDLRLLKKGMTGVFKLKKESDANSIPVSISGISPLVSPVTGTAQAELAINLPQDSKLSAPPIGSMGHVEFHVNKHKGIMVKSDAVTYYGHKTFLYLLDKEIVKKTEVKLGDERMGEIEILSGIEEGATLIERFSEHLEDGEKVKVEKGSKG
jgi:multidrug efflux pump subunit AcrA (membrane-fusion protein)